MRQQDFDMRREALLAEIRAVMNDVEDLYHQGVEVSADEAQDLKTRLEAKLAIVKNKLADFESETEASLKYQASKAKERFQRFTDEASEQFRYGKERLRQFEEQAEEQVRHHAKQADKVIREKPYYAIGFAALAGLVVGILLNNRR